MYTIQYDLQVLTLNGMRNKTLPLYSGQKYNYELVETSSIWGSTTVTQVTQI